MFLSLFLCPTSCIPVPGPLAWPPDKALIPCQALPTPGPRGCGGPTSPHLQLLSHGLVPGHQPQAPPLGQLHKTLGHPFEARRAGLWGLGVGRERSHPRVSEPGLPFQGHQASRGPAYHSPDQTEDAGLAPGLLPPGTHPPSTPTMDIGSFSPNGSQKPQQHEPLVAVKSDQDIDSQSGLGVTLRHSWIPLLSLETGGPHSHPTGNPTELGTGGISVPVGGPGSIMGGCALVFLPVAKGTLGPGLGVCGGATVAGEARVRCLRTQEAKSCRGAPPHATLGSPALRSPKTLPSAWPAT